MMMMMIIIIIIIITLFQEGNIFGTDASLIYGPQFTNVDMCRTFVPIIHCIGVTNMMCEKHYYTCL